jgi:hypothetical protein
VATYRAEYWMLNKYITKRQVTFERKVSRKMCGGIKVNENWRKRYNKELMQLFGDLDILLSECQLNCIGHVNRMSRKRNVSQVFNNNPQGSRLRGQPKKQMLELCTNRY